MSVWMYSWLVSAFLFPSQSSGGPTLTLQASSLRPYLGQVVHLELRLTAPTPITQPWTLQIPWLRREEVGFQWLLPPEEWVCRHVRQSAMGAPLQLGPHRLGPSRREGTNTFLWTWDLVIHEPDPLQPQGLRFGPVHITDNYGHAVQSNPVLLETRPLPVPPTEPNLVRLGVGDFQMEVRLEPPTVRLGEATVLLLCVRGKGLLEAIPTPPLWTLSNWKSDAFYLEPLAETWQERGQVRCFRYRLQPRKMQGELRLPAVSYLCFDPEREKYQSRNVSIPALPIHPPTETTAQGTQPLLPNQLPERLRLFALESSTPTPRTWHSPNVLLGIILPFLLLLAWLVFPWWRERWRQGPTATLAGRTAWKLLHSTADAIPQRTTAALTAYLQMRYGLLIVEPTWREMEALLARYEVPPAVREQVRQLQYSLEELRFSHLPQIQAEELLRLAEQLLREWERVQS